METGDATGTLEHGRLKPCVSVGSGVPVCSDGKCETGTLEHQPATALFVSTGLESWTTGQPRIFARDVEINDNAYRRLDPEYYAWLRSKMNLAKMANDAGKLGRDEFDELRRRFNAVHKWAFEHFGELALAEAVRNLDAREYRPPAMELAENSRTKRRAAVCPTTDVVAMVDAIAEKALALGWVRERLYCSGKSMFDPHRKTWGEKE